MYTQSTSNTAQILTIYCALQHCVYSFNVFSCSIYICTGDPFSWFFDHIIHNHFNNSSFFISVLLVAFLHVVFIQFLVLHFRSTSLSHSSVQVVYLSVLHRVQLWLQVFATLQDWFWSPEINLFPVDCSEGEVGSGYTIRWLFGQPLPLETFFQE